MIVDERDLEVYVSWTHVVRIAAEHSRGNSEMKDMSSGIWMALVPDVMWPLLCKWNSTSKFKPSTKLVVTHESWLSTTLSQSLTDGHSYAPRYILVEPRKLENAIGDIPCLLPVTAGPLPSA